MHPSSRASRRAPAFAECRAPPVTPRARASSGAAPNAFSPSLIQQLQQSPVLRASRRVRQHGLLRKLVLRRTKNEWVRQRANDRPDGLGLGPSGAGTRGRARSKLRGAPAGGGLCRGRDRTESVAERTVESGWLPRSGSLSRSAQRGCQRVRTVVCILSLVQYPCVFVGWFQFFFLRTTGATKRARGGQRQDVRCEWRRWRWEDGRGRPVESAPRGPIGGSVKDFAARTLPRTSPASGPCATRTRPVASRDPPSCWRGTE